MTPREHYELLLKERMPSTPREFNEAYGYYHNVVAQFGWIAFQHRGCVNPTEKAKITKEQLAELMKDNPETLVPRLNGIYGDKQGPSNAIEREAARRIVQLEAERDELVKALRISTCGLQHCSRWNISEEKEKALMTQVIANDTILSRYPSQD